MPAPTKKSNLVIPELLTEAIQGAFAGMNALWGTDAVVTNDALGSRLKGEKVAVPYFGNLGDMQDVLTDETDYNPNPFTAADIAFLTSSKEEAIVQHSRKVFSITEWAQMSAAGDPYTEGARQLVETVRRRIDKALIAAASTAAWVPELDATIAPYTAPFTMTYDAMVDGKYQLGDELDQNEGFSLGVTHSKVARDLEKLKDSQGNPLVVNPVDGKLTRVAGIPIAKSDKLTDGVLVTPKYTSLFAKPKSMAVWYNKTAMVVKTSEDIINDVEVAAVHLYYCVHVYKQMPGGTKPGVVRIKSR
jgi:hypothetical protein